MRGPRSWSWPMLFMALVTASTSTWGQTPQASSSLVDPFYGSLATTVPIAVPAFHGLEPDLKLLYSSTAGNGQVGVGWALGGFSSIERASFGKGSPRYDGSDIYILDGQELMLCGEDSTSPSCTTHGTHATRIESYQRIKFDAAVNTWTVWRKDGARLVYSPLYRVSRGTTQLGVYRWGLSSVTDTSGNSVAYSWWCDGNPTLDCYPDSVSYNGIQVRLYREERPDPSTFVNGSGTLGLTQYRLKTVDVLVGRNRVRAYALTYTSSASSGRSLLTSVKQLGRDALLDPTGTILSGTALPASTYQYDAAAATIRNQSWANGHGVGDAGSSYANIDGDGKAEYVTHSTNGTHYATFFNRDGSLTNRSWANGHGVGNAGWTYTDINGDGRADYVTHSTDGTHYATFFNGTSVINRSWANGHGVGNAGSGYADIDGDGKVEYVTHSTSGAHYITWLASGGDLLSSMEMLGGSTRIQYQPSSAWVNTSLPQGLVLQTVSAVTLSDGRGSTSTTHYKYQGGLWSSSERRFLGFRKVTAVLDAAGNYTETFYHQHAGCISKPDATYYRDAAGNIFSYSSYAYTESSAPPYTSLLTERWDYECNQTTSCRRVLVQLAYDEYGNATTSLEYGDYDLSGDERTTLRGYVPNVATYVVAAKAYENVYAGIGTRGALIQQTLHSYDGTSIYTTPPTAGRLTRTHSWNSLTGDYLATEFTYDKHGNQTSSTSPTGATSTTEYDETFHVFPLRECDTLGRCHLRAWDTVLGLEVSNTDINGITATTTYDVFGRPLSESKAGRQVQFSYLSWGDPTRQRVRQTLSDGTPDGLWVETYSDGLGREWRRVKDGGATQDILYSDSSSRVWKRSSWYGPDESPRYQVFAYDGAGRIRSITNPDGSQSHITYGVGYSVLLDELGREKVLWSDPWGRTTQIREKNGQTYAYTTYERDPLGRVLRVVDAAGNPFGYSFNSLGWKVAECDPDVGCLDYTYDGAGNLLTQRNARDEVITYSYDEGGRRTSRTWPDGSKVQWSYDERDHGAGMGRLTSVKDPNGSESFFYDALGRVTSTTKCVRGTCYTLQQTYDDVDRVTSLKYPDGEVVTYGYDTAGRLTSVSGYVQSMTYNVEGQLLTAQYANGTTTTYTYDAKRQWLTSSQVTGSTGTLYQARYTYDAAAQVTAMSSATNPLLNLTFGYDDLGRLTRVTGSQSQFFTYDALGNITWNSRVGHYAYEDPAHRHGVTTAGGRRYTYDAAGNMLSGSDRKYEWNYDHQLVSVSTGSSSTRFRYDYSGQRVYKSGPSGTSLYFGSFIELRNGVLVKNYYAGPLLVATRDGHGPRWFHTDHLGSIRLVTRASGAVLDRYDYAAFGATVRATGTSNSERGFGGHRTDPETGLVYMNARYYDPALGRFLSADALVPDPDNPQAFNRYAFAYNNPISNTDPTGHAPVVSAVVAVATALAAPSSALSFVALVGTATTITGYVLKNPVLSTIGSVLMGFVAGGPFGAAVAAVTSPLSPLDPGVKQAIGWAFTAYGLIQELNGMLVSAKLPTPDGSGAPLGFNVFPIRNETGNVSIYILGGQAAVRVSGLFTGKPGTPLWDILSRDIADIFANMVGELGPTARFIQDTLVKYGIQPQNVTYLGHSLGAWTGLTLLRQKQPVVGNVVGMAMPLPGLAQLTELPVQRLSHISLPLGANDPVAGMLGGLGAGHLFARSLGARVDVLNTGGYSIKAHVSDSYCRANAALCMK